jgi:hypothetical protein
MKREADRDADHGADDPALHAVDRDHAMSLPECDQSKGVRAAGYIASRLRWAASNPSRGLPPVCVKRC